MVEFHVLPSEVNGSNNITISTLLHSACIWPALFLIGPLLNAVHHRFKPSFHMITHDRRIAENTASGRQQLYGNTF